MQNFTVDLIIEEKDGESPVCFNVKTLAVAMFCERHADASSIIEHQRKNGWQLVCEVFPDFCRVSRYLLTTDNTIEVQGNMTCGEVEVVALVQDDDILIGVGSDHCDRAIEPAFYYKPKQMCPRVLGPRVWRYEDVAGHWDEMVLTSSVITQGREVSFQRGNLSTLLRLPDLLDRGNFPGDGLVMYCGTVALPDDYVYSEGFSMELHDPVLNRTLKHTYFLSVLNDLA